MKSLFFGLLTILILASSCKTYRAKQERAWNNIETLNNGVLLVRLQTGEKKVAALKKAGLPEKAEKADKNQKEINRRIIKVFGSPKFTFCPVYFFYQKDSDKVKNNDFSGVLLDSDLKPIENSNVVSKNQWLLVERGLSQNPLIENEDGTYSPGPPGASHGRMGLIFKDRTFRMLEKPFPYKWGDTEIETLFNLNLFKVDIDYDAYGQKANYYLENFANESSIKKQKWELKKKRKALKNG